MGLPVTQPASDQRSRSWRIARIQGIHIERNRKTTAALGGDGDRFIHTRREPPFINFAHGEEAHPQLTNQFSFTLIEIARADVGTKSRIELGSETTNVHQFG